MNIEKEYENLVNSVVEDFINDWIIPQNAKRYLSNLMNGENIMVDYLHDISTDEDKNWIIVRHNTEWCYELDGELSFTIAWGKFRNDCEAEFNSRVEQMLKEKGK